MKTNVLHMYKALVLVFLLGGCATERSPITGEKERYGFTWEQEQQIGKESDVQISQQLGIYEDEGIQQYVVEIGEAILSSSDFANADLPERYRDTDFTFRVLDSPVVNAFALPGGYVYVTRGLLAHAENEAQLAVVLGHEIGHVAGRHSAQQALKSQWSQLGLMAGVILGSKVLGEDYTRDIFGVGGTVMQLLLSKYSRDHEREADSLGVLYAARQGYNAGEGAGFFQTLDRMAQQGGGRIPSWQATHPEPAERKETITRMARDLENDHPMDKVNADRFNRAIDGLVYGKNPREGYVEDGTFIHPELRFRFDPPANWTVQNERFAVLMIDSSQKAMMAFEITPAASARAAAQELLRVQGLNVMRTYDLKINGSEAYVVEARAQTQQGPVALVNTFIEYGGRVYSLLGYTSEANFGSARGLFLNTANSFGPVTDPKHLNVEPYRLAVFQAEARAPFRAFIPAELPEGTTAQDLAILNQVEIEQVIDRGEWVKIPRR